MSGMTTRSKGGRKYAYYDDLLLEERNSSIPSAYDVNSEYECAPSTSYNVDEENDLFKDPEQDVKEEIKLEEELEFKSEINSEDTVGDHKWEVEDSDEEEDSNGPASTNEELGPLPEEEINPKTGKPFKCRFCGKPFTKRSSVKRHYRLHSDEKPYECPICLGKFKALANLKRHQNLHLEDKVIKYEPVLPNSAWRGEVEQYRLVINPPQRKRRRPLCEPTDESFSCRMCEQQFPHFGHLLKHYSGVHGLNGMTTWKTMYGNSEAE